ncbi:MAG: hypothetical protein AB1305_00920 [Candidatus Hadarchaeota archaeon]
MVSDVFLRGKAELLKMLKPGGVLDQQTEREIMDVYGGRGKRAIEAIKGRKVAKRGPRWFVHGRGGEYEVVKDTCTCRDYVMNIVTGKADVDMCYHSLAKTICESLKSYYVVEPVE